MFRKEKFIGWEGAEGGGDLLNGMIIKQKKIGVRSHTCLKQNFLCAPNSLRHEDEVLIDTSIAGLFGRHIATRASLQLYHA